MKDTQARRWMAIAAVMTAAAIVFLAFVNPGSSSGGVRISRLPPVLEPEALDPQKDDKDYKENYNLIRDRASDVAPAAKVDLSSQGRDGVTVEIKVLGPDSLPRPDARVVLRHGMEGVLLWQGATDGAGVAHAVIQAPVRSVTLTVTAAQAARYRADLGMPLPDLHLVQLVAPARLEGSVVLFDGRSAPEGFEVCAWRSLAMPWARFQSVRHLEEEVHTAQTNRFGEFVIDNLEADREYSLIAGGPGWCMPSSVRWTVRSDTKATLKVLGLYASALELVTVDGRRPPPSSGWSMSHGRPDIAGLRMLRYPGIEAEIAGVSAANINDGGHQADWRNRNLVYAAEVDRDFLEGFSCRIRAPGYAEDVSKFSVPRWRGKWKSSNVILRTTASGFGEMELVFGTHLRDLSSGWGHDIRVIMKPSGGYDKPFEIPVKRTGGSVFLAGIPYGRYTVQVQSMFGWTWPRNGVLEVEIGVNPFRLVIPEAEFGGVLISIVNPDATLRAPAVSMLCKYWKSAHEYSVYLEGDPILLYGLLPGEYEFKMESVGLAPEILDLGRVQVDAGQVSKISARWKNP